MRNKNMTMKLMRTTQRKKVKKSTVLKIMVKKSQRSNQLMTQLKSNLKIVSLLVISKEDVHWETDTLMLRLAPLWRYWTLSLTSNGRTRQHIITNLVFTTMRTRHKNSTQSSTLCLSRRERLLKGKRQPSGEAARKSDSKWETRSHSATIIDSEEVCQSIAKIPLFKAIKSSYISYLTTITFLYPILLYYYIITYFK